MKSLKRFIISLCAVSALMLTACGGGNAEASASVSEMVQGIADSGVQFEELTPGENDDDVTAYHYSVEKEWYSEYASLSATAASADEIVIFKASAPENTDKLKSALESYLEKRKADFEQYAPDEFDKLSKCGVTVKGDYVCLIISSDNDTANKKFNSYF
ncbi:MAG: DUF4358 domain-containing protein [Oscillospiraceae bacterium]